MAPQPVRLPPAGIPGTPTHHSLDPIRIAGQTIQLSVTIRHDDDGAWRGRLRFMGGAT